MHVHVIDDDSAMRRMLQTALEMESLPVMAHESAAAFLESFDPADAGCIVLDLRMPGIDGMELLKKLHGDGIKTPVIVISGHADVPEAVQSMKLGAVDMLQKPFKIATLVELIRGAIKSSENDTQATTNQQELRRLFDGLTRREIELTKLIVQGQSSKQIAASLHISIATVTNHRVHIMAKTKAANVADLVRMATIAGLGPSA